MVLPLSGMLGRKKKTQTVATQRQIQGLWLNMSLVQLSRIQETWDAPVTGNPWPLAETLSWHGMGGRTPRDFCCSPVSAKP